MELKIIQNKIYEIRGHKIMLDSDLAELYGVETKVLNQSVKRNNTRFPEDFMFQLTDNEINILRSQFVTLEKPNFTHFRYNPFVFTEQGVAMLSSVLKSERAVQVNIAIIRAFVMLRQYAMNYQELRDKIAEMEAKYDEKFEDINEVLNYLMSPKSERKTIGFQSIILVKQHHPIQRYSNKTISKHGKFFENRRGRRNN